MKMNDELRKAGREFDKRLRETIKRVDKARAEKYRRTACWW
jgi:hypothetical protein